MAFENFKPEIWSDTVLVDRDTVCVGVNNSWKEFSGAISGKGDRVHIEGIKGATIKDMTSNTIDDPEDIEDEQLDLVIDQKKYINFKQNDIDKLQANVDVMQKVVQETANNYALVQDKFIYKLAKDGAGKTIDAKTSGSELTSANVFDLLNDALAYIRCSNASYSDMFIECNPYITSKIFKAFINLGNTNNAEIKNGFRGDFGGAKIYETNAVLPYDSTGAEVTSGSTGAIYPIIIRTNRAIAFAEQKSLNFKPYEIEKGFGEGIKGYGLYGGKVVYPNELVVIEAKIGAESAT